MKRHRLSNKDLSKYEVYLNTEERAQATIAKYQRDLTAFLNVKFLLGLGIAFVGFYGMFQAFISVESDSERKEELAGMDNKMKEKDEEVAKEKRWCESCNAKYIPLIDGLKKDSAEIRSRIVECQEYINMGVDKVSTYWFTERCHSIGIQQPMDIAIEEMRTKVYHVSDEMIEVKCPRCGKPNKIKKAEYYFDNETKCKHCNSYIIS